MCARCSPRRGHGSTRATRRSATPSRTCGGPAPGRGDPLDRAVHGRRGRPARAADPAAAGPDGRPAPRSGGRRGGRDPRRGPRRRPEWTRAGSTRSSSRAARRPSRSSPRRSASRSDARPSAAPPAAAAHGAALLCREASGPTARRAESTTHADLPAQSDSRTPEPASPRATARHRPLPSRRIRWDPFRAAPDRCAPHDGPVAGVDPSGTRPHGSGTTDGGRSRTGSRQAGGSAKAEADASRGGETAPARRLRRASWRCSERCCPVPRGSRSPGASGLPAGVGPWDLLLLAAGTHKLSRTLTQGRGDQPAAGAVHPLPGERRAGGGHGGGPAPRRPAALDR